MGSKTNDNAFTCWLKQLQKHQAPTPWLVPNHKFYMAHMDYEPKVTVAFNAEWPAAGLSRAHALHFCVKIAQRLFNAESVDVKEQIESEATAAHKVALAMHVSDIKAEPTEDPDAQDRYAHSILFCQTFIPSTQFLISELTRI